MELQRRGLVLGLLTTPFVILTPGLLMPVSARIVVPDPGRGGRLDLCAQTRELAKRLSELRAETDAQCILSAYVPSGSYEEVGVTVADNTVSMQEFLDTIVEPAAYLLTNRIAGRQISPIPLEFGDTRGALPKGGIQSCRDHYGDVSVRGVRYCERGLVRTRFDVRHSRALDLREPLAVAHGLGGVDEPAHLVPMGGRPQRQVEAKGLLVDDENFRGITPWGVCPGRV